MEKAEGLYYTENTQSNTEALAHYSVELKFQNMTGSATMNNVVIKSNTSETKWILLEVR